MEPIRLAFSPDSDDIFMFWPLLRGKVSSEGLAFVADRADTETLNARAEGGDVDVCAVSIAQYGRVARDFVLFPHGMSVGRGYGPVVVAPRPMTRAELTGKRIGVPGLRTTAYLVLRLLVPDFEPVVVPIAPYARAFEALRGGDVDAALLIHEGRLFYEREGMHQVIDLGEGWAELTGGLPLPLGGNVVRRSLGPEIVARVSRVCQRSIAWAIENRGEVARALLDEETRSDLKLDASSLDRYLAMYANADTAAAGDDVVRAIVALFDRGRRAGLLPPDAEVELAP